MMSAVDDVHVSAEEWPYAHEVVHECDVCEQCGAWLLLSGSLALLVAQSAYALFLLLWCSLVLTLAECASSPAYTQHTVPKEMLRLDWAQRTLWRAPTDAITLWHQLSPLSPQRRRHES
jgi:hypothetical protein